MKNLTEEQIRNIPALKQEGYTTLGIARLYHVHPTAIRYWYKRLDAAGHVIKPDPIGRPRIQLELKGDKVELSLKTTPDEKNK